MLTLIWNCQTSSKQKTLIKAWSFTNTLNDMTKFRCFFQLSVNRLMDPQWALFLVGFKCILSINHRRKVEWVVATLQVISRTLLGPNKKFVLWEIGEESYNRTFRLILSLWNLLWAADLHSSYLKVTGVFLFCFFDIWVKIPCLKCLKAGTTNRARESRKNAMGFHFLVFIFNLFFFYMNEILLTLPRSSLKSKY